MMQKRQRERSTGNLFGALFSDARFCLVCLLLLIVVCCSASDEECKCSKLPTGKWDITFEETVVPGYAKNGKLVLKHRYNEVFYGKADIFRR